LPLLVQPKLALHRIAGLVLDPYLDARRFGEVIENLRWLALGKLSAIEINVNLDAALDVDEVVKIRDVAAAMAAAARIAKNKNAEKRARAVRVRAERKAGALSKEIRKAKIKGPGRGIRTPDAPEKKNA
jgi:ribosomal 50S subunit-recycling heat shock protein